MNINVCMFGLFSFEEVIKKETNFYIPFNIKQISYVLKFEI
jgi:hypothetical protein